MGADSVVAGRYRLDGLAQPEDPCTYVATDLIERQQVLVCLVTSDSSGAARTRRAIEHPALLRVRDVIHGVDRAVPPLTSLHGRASGFVVIDLPESETLAGRVERKGRLELPPAVRTVMALTNALAAIHADGAIHGSVVPEAIELRELDEGGPRLGLAGVSDRSLAFESPPRLCGEGPSEPDDMWGLLGCLYFAVTGAPPFSAESPAALARRILGGRPMPLPQSTPSAVALQKIFDRGFSRTAGLRYASADELREDLRAWLSRHATHSDAPMVSVAPPPNPATTTARRRQAIDAELMKKALPSDRPFGEAPMKLANRPLDRLSDRPPPTVPRSSSDRPTEGAIPASRRGDPAGDDAWRLTSDYPSLEPRSPRSFTAPWSDQRASNSDPAPPVAVREVDPHRPATAWPSAPKGDEPPVTPRSGGVSPLPPRPEPVKRTSSETTVGATPLSRLLASDASSSAQAQPQPQPPCPREGTASPSETTLAAVPRSRLFAAEPEASSLDASGGEPGHGEETVRISREQLIDLESMARASPASEASMVAARDVEREAKTDPPAAPDEPPHAPPAAPPPEVPTKGATLAFVAGLGVAASLAAAYFGLRREPATPQPSASATSVVSARPATTSAPRASTVAPTASASTAAHDHEPVAACVARWFPPETFETSSDFAWVCDATDGRRAVRDMQRAVVAGGRGLRVTEGMRDWARYRWFQYPVLLTLRQACCPNPIKLELPRGSPACPSATESITPLGLAAAQRDGDLEAPIRQLRRMASCMAETGDASFFALEGPMGGGEETLFRAFVARGRR